MDAVTKRTFGLDLMRTTAILMVLCSHSLSIYPRSTNRLSQIFALFGYWGVEIFFVLSGFLIGNILYKLFTKEDFNRQSVFYFLQRRWFRTLPNYYFILILNILLAYIFGFYIKDAAYYFLFLQNFAQPMKPFFPESWSLAVEEYAYLITPFALLFSTLFFRLKTNSKGYFSVIIVFIAFFFFTKVVYYFNTNNVDIYEWNVDLKPVVIYRIDSILIGVLASWISINFAVFWKNQMIKLFFLGLILLVVMFVGIGFFRIRIEEYPFVWNVLYLPLTAIIFTFFLPFLSNMKSAPIWFNKPITFISLISYSIYLLHYSILLQLMKHFFDLDNFSITQLHIFTLCYLVITFYLSYLLYKYFEKPITNLRA